MNYGLRINDPEAVLFGFPGGHQGLEFKKPVVIVYKSRLLRVLERG